MATKKKTAKKKNDGLTFEYTDKNNKKKKIKMNNKQSLIAVIAIILIITIVGIAYLINPNAVIKAFNLIFSSKPNTEITNPDTINFEGINQNLKNDFSGRIANSLFDDNSTVSAAASGSLKVNYIDVGQGDCILIQYPDGKNMLIDGGDNSTEISNSIKAYLDSKNISTLDYVMLTHTDSDHVGSLDEVIENYEVKNVFMPMLYASNNPDIDNEDKIAGSISTAVYKSFYNAVLNETYKEGGNTFKTKVIFNVGVLYIIGADYKMTIYSPEVSYYTAFCYADGNKNIEGTKAEDVNNMSPVCILEYAGRKMVFTGDADELSENRFMEYCDLPDDCDVLKAGHHGSSGSSNQIFLDFIDVEYTVISVGADNTYGHPTPETLLRLSSTTIYRTDEDGDIVLTVTSTGLINITV